MKVLVNIEPGEDGWYVATVPALPGCVSQGKTLKEAKANIVEAIELYLAPDDEDIKVTYKNLVSVEV